MRLNSEVDAERLQAERGIEEQQALAAKVAADAAADDAAQFAPVGVGGSSAGSGRPLVTPPGAEPADAPQPPQGDGEQALRQSATSPLATPAAAPPMSPHVRAAAAAASAAVSSTPPSTGAQVGCSTLCVCVCGGPWCVCADRQLRCLGLQQGASASGGGAGAGAGGGVAHTTPRSGGRRSSRSRGSTPTQSGRRRSRGSTRAGL